MAGPLRGRAFRPSTYSGTPPRRLWSFATARAAALAGTLALGLTSGACSVSYQLGSLFGKDDDAVKHTGSILEPKAKAEQQADSDLDYARAAAAEVLDSGRKDASLPWENPKSGARGTVTPIAAAYSLDGLECRDFLASYVREGAEAWLRGEACRKQQGRWEVRSLRPWKRS